MKINPKCISGDQATAITNRGEMIPCCQLDYLKGWEDPMVAKLMENSKIDDYDSIYDIYMSDTWTEFFEMLVDDYGPKPIPCMTYCGTKFEQAHQSEETYDPDGNLIKLNMVE